MHELKRAQKMKIWRLITYENQNKSKKNKEETKYKISYVTDINVLLVRLFNDVLSTLKCIQRRTTDNYQ
jgi:hypothetical protein